MDENASIDPFIVHMLENVSIIVVVVWMAYTMLVIVGGSRFDFVRSFRRSASIIVIEGASGVMVEYRRKIRLGSVKKRDSASSNSSSVLSSTKVEELPAVKSCSFQSPWSSLKAELVSSQLSLEGELLISRLARVVKNNQVILPRRLRLQLSHAMAGLERGETVIFVTGIRLRGSLRWVFGDWSETVFEFGE